MAHPDRRSDAGPKKLTDILGGSTASRWGGHRRRLGRRGSWVASSSRWPKLLRYDRAIDHRGEPTVLLRGSIADDRARGEASAGLGMSQNVHSGTPSLRPRLLAVRTSLSGWLSPRSGRNERRVDDALEVSDRHIGETWARTVTIRVQVTLEKLVLGYVCIQLLIEVLDKNLALSYQFARV